MAYLVNHQEFGSQSNSKSCKARLKRIRKKTESLEAEVL